MRKVRFTLLIACALVALLLAAPSRAQGFKDLEGKVVEKTLPNGLKVILLPRSGAPVISMATYANVGGVDEQVGGTGLAHIFEHMAFKGTTTIGTTDYAKEKAAIQKEDEAFLALRAERLKRPAAAPEKIKALEEALKKAEEESEQYVKSNEFSEIVDKEGASGLNAFTAFDQTVYIYSLPSNKLELWAALESDRFSHPVLREFYKEKNVIMEERRMGESNPQGRLFNDFFPVAYQAHPYRSFVIGWMSDLQAITKEQAENWFKKNYGAKNLTCVVVGDVDPATAWPILEKWLGQIPSGQRPDPVVTVEPPQRAEKRFTMEDPTQPFMIIGYHRPDVTSPDDAVYDAISDVLGGGRSSRLYVSLVKEKKLALAAGCSSTVEAQKYPGIFLFYAVPNKGKTNAECEAAIYAEIEKIQNGPVTPEELEGIKARAKAHFLDSIKSNMGLAIGLAFAQNIQGDWREEFKALDKIEKVTAEDIQRVAKATFTKLNRTVGIIETAAPAKEAAKG
jgi:predicted Zn-dependent peptidase